MQCRNCREFESCGHIYKAKKDFNMNEFLKEVRKNETCPDYDPEEIQRTEEQLRLFKNS